MIALTVSGSANITADSFNNSGTITVNNNFNATVDTFSNEAGATITTFGGCNIVYTTSYTDDGNYYLSRLCHRRNNDY